MGIIARYRQSRACVFALFGRSFFRRALSLKNWSGREDSRLRNFIYYYQRKTAEFQGFYSINMFESVSVHSQVHNLCAIFHLGFSLNTEF